MLTYLRTSRTPPFATLDLDPATAEALDEIDLAIEAHHYPAVRAAEAELCADFTPRQMELLHAYNMAKCRLNLDLHAAAFAEGRRLAVVLARIEAQSERDLANAGKG